jgi:hypothetical protein
MMQRMGAEEKEMEVLVAEEEKGKKAVDSVGTGECGVEGKKAAEAGTEAVEQEEKRVEGPRRVGKGVQEEEKGKKEDEGKRKKEVRDGKPRSRWAKWLEWDWYGSVVEY